MGMAASQARFLGLTARKNNVEYEGQQINQQRTALSNQSANYYNDMLGMTVPVPPSIQDFTKIVYTFEDGALTNTITSLIAQADGSYIASYLSNFQQDFSIVSAGEDLIVNSQNNVGVGANGNIYRIGANEIKAIGEFARDNVATNIQGQNFRLDNENSYINANGEKITLIQPTYDIITSIIGKEPQRADYDLQGMALNYASTQCYAGVDINNAYGMGHMEHNLCHLVWGNSERSITSSSGVTITKTSPTTEASLTEPGWGSAANGSEILLFKEKLQEVYPDVYQKIVDLYVDTILYLSDHQYNNTSYDPQTENYTISTTNYDHNQITEENMFPRWEALWEELKSLSPDSLYKRDHEIWQTQYDEYRDIWLNSNDYNDIYTVEEALFYDGNDPYLKSLSSEELEKQKTSEIEWATMLENEYGIPENGGWYIRYIPNATGNGFDPVFYNGNHLATGEKTENGNIYTSIKRFTIGKKEVNREVKNVKSVMERDTSGRYISITTFDIYGNSTTYALTTNTLTDNDAYNDAMNKYEHEKYLYEQAVQEINSKIEITQVQDKNLELRLKQLDTEHNAIQTEIDAVKKVIEKNTESSFKTFG
ncbi:hypothetical protein IKU74_06655 [bacterium]|nr:hypothetical protein [bacterium]